MHRQHNIQTVARCSCSNSCVENMASLVTKKKKKKKRTAKCFYTGGNFYKVGKMRKVGKALCSLANAMLVRCWQPFLLLTNKI